jgi:hypothetical protein
LLFLGRQLINHLRDFNLEAHAIFENQLKICLKIQIKPFVGTLRRKLLQGKMRKRIEYFPFIFLVFFEAFFSSNERKSGVNNLFVFSFPEIGFSK